MLVRNNNLMLFPIIAALVFLGFGGSFLFNKVASGAEPQCELDQKVRVEAEHPVLFAANETLEPCPFDR